MRILGIETSCDETAAAVVQDGRVILSNVVASQAELHARYGGVFPEVASRQHIQAITPVIEEALQQAHLRLADLDALAVTRGPGLPGSLVVGMNAAKGLALAGGLPLLGVNHLEGHLYSAWLRAAGAGQSPAPKGEKAGGASQAAAPADEPEFPALALLVSGGHTELILMRAHLQYERLGGTLDDAAGEAFDKAARLLGLAYPGGPAIQRAALEGNPVRFNFPRAWLNDGPERWNFSFSGLKTSVRRAVEAHGDGPLPAADMAAGFQAAVVDVLVGKTMQAAKAFEAKSLILAGGVSANRLLRQSFQVRAQIPLFIPDLALCTDNAAMIAAVAYYRLRYGPEQPGAGLDGLGLDVLPNWEIA